MVLAIWSLNKGFEITHRSPEPWASLKLKAVIPLLNFFKFNKGFEITRWSPEPWASLKLKAVIPLLNLKKFLTFQLKKVIIVNGGGD